jgi:hypothetical protein
MKWSYEEIRELLRPHVATPYIDALFLAIEREIERTRVEFETAEPSELVKKQGKLAGQRVLQGVIRGLFSNAKET